MKKTKAHAPSKSPQNLLYNVYALPLVILQRFQKYCQNNGSFNPIWKLMFIAHSLSNKNNGESENRYRSNSRDQCAFEQNATSTQYTRSRYYNYNRDSRSYHSASRYLCRTPYRRDSLPRKKSCSALELFLSKNKLLLSYLLLDQANLELLDQILITHETNSILFKQKHPLFL